MKSFLTITSIFLIIFITSAAMVRGQEDDEDEKETPPKRESVDRSIFSTRRNGNNNGSLFTGLIDKIAGKVDRGVSHLSGIGQRLQDHYARHTARLQNKAISSLERLRSYIDRRIQPESEGERDYLKRLRDAINEMIESLRNLWTSVPRSITNSVTPKPIIEVDDDEQ